MSGKVRGARESSALHRQYFEMGKEVPGRRAVR